MYLASVYSEQIFFVDGPHSTGCVHSLKRQPVTTIYSLEIVAIFHLLDIVAITNIDQRSQTKSMWSAIRFYWICRMHSIDSVFIWIHINQFSSVYHFDQCQKLAEQTFLLWPKTTRSPNQIRPHFSKESASRSNRYFLQMHWRKHVVQKRMLFGSYGKCWCAFCLYSPLLLMDFLWQDQNYQKITAPALYIFFS